jgi:hypothetical protein
MVTYYVYVNQMEYFEVDTLEEAIRLCDSVPGSHVEDSVLDEVIYANR